jgi:hypothetical protein
MGEGAKSQPDKESGWGKWLIITIVGIFVAASGWYLDICLKEQKETVRATKETWSLARETSQKYIDDRTGDGDRAAPLTYLWALCYG